MPLPFFKKKILVVEDSKPLSNAVTIKLKSRGFKVLFASSLEDASKILDKNKKISAVWLDHWLKNNTNGLQVLDYVKNHDNHKNVPVFLVSACGEEWSEKYELQGITKRFVKSDHSMAEIADTIVQEIGE